MNVGDLVTVKFGSIIRTKHPKKFKPGYPNREYVVHQSKIYIFVEEVGNFSKIMLPETGDCYWVHKYKISAI